ncbi:MAG: protein phosphatase 2C domain-containing protein [Chloroflexi bacterium]|nr:protein phosphatase 2C domain-containing protein [Chloroflexota bacterium]MYK36102.1 protein phosphatase 2C domain-containing protein [Chloroflexota bacterium]
MSERARKGHNDGVLGLRVAHASRQGASHQKDGTPNQDSALVAMPSAGRLSAVAIMAVSDGAGSAINSQQGSKAACVAGVESLTRRLNRNPAIAVREHLLRSALKRAVRNARQSVIATARKLHGAANVNEYACTLMLTLTSAPLVGVAHVGDGCIVAGDGEVWRLLSEPDNGEFANETKFLTNPRNLPRVTVSASSDIRCVAAITDGLQDVALSRGSAPYDRFWTPLYRALNRAPLSSSETVLEAMLQKVADANKATDDCTIAVCVKAGEG